MTCKKCKKEISAENKFCPECGEKTEKEYKPDFVLVGKPIPAFLQGKAREEYISSSKGGAGKKKQMPYWPVLVTTGIAGIICWQIFHFTLLLYFAGLAFLVVPAYFGYKNNEFNLVSSILYAVMVLGVLINFFTGAMWAIYLLLASIVGLGLHEAFQEDKKMTPQQKEKEFKAAFYDVWKQKVKREGKTIDPNEEQFYKKEQSKFDAKNTLTITLPMVIFAVLQKEFGVPQAMLIGVFSGVVIRFLYPYFDKKI